MNWFPRFWLCYALSLVTAFQDEIGSWDEEQLMIDLFKNYNALVRPSTGHNESAVEVKFGVAMILLINVDEKNQVMQTNVWLTMEWFDYQLSWNSFEYGKITTIRVPPEKVWLPDIVLFNNADGNYEVSFRSNVVINNNGKLMWVPPAIYKSSCLIDVEFFPFDEQTCPMTFGSWTYSEEEVVLGWFNDKQYVELNDYAHSGIWDVIRVPGKKEKDARVKFCITIRRKTLFYTVILIIPTALMAFLSTMVFYLPADASEKITLAISLLLALVVFLLLVSKILPPTSSTIPLMAKYLLLTFVMNVNTILVTVIIINIYFRTPTTHTMSAATRIIFLKLLPRVLLMKRPKINFIEKSYTYMQQATQYLVGPCFVPAAATENFHDNTLEKEQKPYTVTLVTNHHPNCKIQQEKDAEYANMIRRGSSNAKVVPKHVEVTPDIQNAFEAIHYIVEHLKNTNNTSKVEEDWKYVAMVIDRLVLYIFFGITLGGTCGILLSAPNVFEWIDQKTVIQRLMQGNMFVDTATCKDN